MGTFEKNIWYDRKWREMSIPNHCCETDVAPPESDLRMCIKTLQTHFWVLIDPEILFLKIYPIGNIRELSKYTYGYLLRLITSAK